MPEKDRKLGTYCLGILGNKSHAFSGIYGKSLIFSGKLDMMWGFSLEYFV
jgi:hypothetical protein